MRNTFGSAVSLTIFGESHGPAIGAVLDGLAPGLAVDEGFIARQMDKRRARGDGLSTGRTERDAVRLLSGVCPGPDGILRTCGTPVALLIENQNVRPADYDALKRMPRPGHADFAANAKYLGWQDARGGGHFSGRVTAALVAAGALCQSVLAARGVRIGTHLAACAGIPDAPFAPCTDPAALAAQIDALNAEQQFAVLDAAAGEAMRAAVRAAAAEGDSVGGILETAVLGLPAGVGEPFFDSVESVLSHLLFSIPAVKGVEFGAGFGMAGLRGSAANDPFVFAEGPDGPDGPSGPQNGPENRIVRTATNHNGGVNGGVSNGMPLLLRSAVKPTPSIYKPQQTVDLAAGQSATLQIAGRHDPCILHRARVVQDSAVALGLLDLLTQRFGLLWQSGGAAAPAPQIEPPTAPQTAPPQKGETP